MEQTEQGATHFVMQVAPVTKNQAQTLLRPILGRPAEIRKNQRTSFERSGLFCGRSLQALQNIP
ncbi:hypothetical protein N018_23565 [Pseudomonas syringae CC1557]|uniref:Uncharacterized protein n=1 Tax=Pseudomonas syringae CC1557 TaxID=1357279 RepID=W0N3N2_PSESX|nr:hypothetical protein [Pseudomonas syringae]AHG43686.1 hypothetical protein N018_23565 [Pseudomonas syringae CC1557]